MATWNELLEKFSSVAPDQQFAWLNVELTEALNFVGSAMSDTNVILYGSAFLQKQDVPASSVSITHEDINGFMSAVHGLDRSKGLTLILHTPGGVVTATETIVSYLRQSFDDITVIVPSFAMSAGTMISLASDRIYLSKHGQLGPIDPQMPLPGGRSFSARAIVEQFTVARAEIVANPLTAHAWAPVTSSLGPALLQESQNALDYSEEIVANWLEHHMFSARPDAAAKSKEVAEHFNDAAKHKSHGRRIGYTEAKDQGLSVELLEEKQDLQDAVLTAYHLMTIMFEQSLVTKLLWGSQGHTWIKSWAGTA